MLTDLVRFLWRNVGTLLFAFALALTVWISSVVTDNPNEECVTPRFIPLDVIGLDPTLEVMNEIPSQIQVDFYAPRSICTRLRDEGVHNATIDLTGLGSGDHELPVVVPDPEQQPVRILGYNPPEVEVSLERFTSVTFPVVLTVTGEPALGFQADTLSIDVEEVTVSGPESSVAQVVRVETSLDITSARETFQRNLGLRAVDEEGDVVSGLTLSPNRVAVTQNIVQLGQYRELAVQVKTTGQWATGYRLTSISVSPPTITVFSVDPESINELPGFVETMPIDLTEANDDIAASVELNLPEGVNLVGRETVFVQVSIAAIQDNLIVNLPVELIGLSPELTAQLSPATVDVILFGPLPVLEDLTSANVRVVVDVSGKGEGTWQETPLVDILPDQVQELGINPALVEVVLSLIPTPTPTPTPDISLTPTSTPTPGS
jgi:YbbR domain-containing protein